MAQMAITTTLVGGAIQVEIANVPGGDDFGLYGDSGGSRAFGFNVAGPDNTVVISNLTAGFTYAGPDVNNLGGGLGDFEFVINGPHTAQEATLPLRFTVTRSGGFTSDSDLYEANALGYVFGAHVKNLNRGSSSFLGFAESTGIEDSTPQLAAVPELHRSCCSKADSAPMRGREAVVDEATHCQVIDCALGRRRRTASSQSVA